MVDNSKIKPGDRVQIKAAHRCGWIRGWRKVTGLDPNNGAVLVTAAGWSDFQLRPWEILKHEPQAVAA